MVRPVRKLWKMRTVVRRRHRSWMLSMTLASFGWGAWWVAVILTRFAPEVAPGLRTTCIISSAFAAAGFLAALWTIRARLVWILMTLVPLLANGSLLLVPIAIKAVRVIRD